MAPAALTFIARGKTLSRTSPLPCDRSHLLQVSPGFGYLTACGSNFFTRYSGDRVRSRCVYGYRIMHSFCFQVRASLLLHTNFAFFYYYYY